MTLEMRDYVLDKEQIKQIIPHREPFLFLDKVIEVGEDFIIAQKTITKEDCEGHFPGSPIFPGHLSLEALAQSATCLVLFNHPELKSERIVVMVESEGKFSQPILPENIIVLSVWLKKSKLGMYFFEGNIVLNHNGQMVVKWKGIGSIL
jgi:3-hydroxymyristoyl/3-hydroxydecanoyl-(acyl carrier protein) dehydratase